MSENSAPHSGFFVLPALWLLAEPDDASEAAERQDEVARHAITGGLDLSVSRDGLFIFHASAPYPKGVEGVAALLSERVQLLNAYLNCLYAAITAVDGMGLPKYRIDRQEMVQQYGTGKSFTCSNNLVWALAAGPDRKFSAWGAKAHYFPPAPEPGTALDMRSHVVSEQALDLSVTMLRLLLQEGAGALARAALYLTAVHAAENYSFNQSLVEAWFGCEAILGDWWEDYIEQASGGTLSKARLSVLNGKDFTASMKGEILQLAGILPEELYERINRVRSLRNKAAHKLKAITYAEAELALTLYGDLMSVRYQQPLRLFLAPTFAL